MTDRQRPTYSDIAHAYLREAYRAWQERDGALAATVTASMGLLVPEDMDFRRELVRLGLIDGPHDDPGDFRLLPRGIALMDGSPSLDSLLALGGAALDQAAPNPREAETARRRWHIVVMEWAVKRGLDEAWANRRMLWAMLRARFEWLPDLPADPGSAI